jgi:hypothetical protein
MNDHIVTLTYAGASIFLSVSLVGFAFIFFVGNIYADLGPNEITRLIVKGEFYKFVHAKLSEFGYPRLWVIANFSVAGAGFIMCMLSRFVEPPVNRNEYVPLFLIPLALGIILHIGFSTLIDWLASVFGIVFTVLGILFYIKKLSEMKP